MLTKRVLFWGLILIFMSSITQAQDALPCAERPFLVDFPRINPLIWCLEHIIVAESADEQLYTSLLISDDGAIIATHPYRGQVVVLVDFDNDGLPDDEYVLVDNLRYPQGIAEHDDALYILGDGIIYTLSDGEVTTLVDDFPSGEGFLTRAIAIHDEMLYIAIPASCDFCIDNDPLRGTVLRMALDGTDQTIIARGLRYPTALEIYQDALWVTDTARDAFSIDTAYDEVNRIDLGADEIPHFGFPYCVGADNIPDLVGDFDCAMATTPIMTFRSNSTPFGLHHYEGDLFENISDRLLITLLGSNNSRYIAGHAIVSVAITEDSYQYETIVPVDNVTNSLPSRWQQPDGLNTLLPQAEFVNNQAGGIFPHLPYDIVTSPDGWLYFSVQGKGLYVLRPRT